jgi:transposase
MCFLDSAGRVQRREKISGHPRRVVEFLRTIDEPFNVCFEASTNYGWMHDELAPIAANVAVAHPSRLRLIFMSKRKNDRIDAERLAKLLYLGEVPTIHVPSIDTRSWRKLVEYRKRAVNARTRVKCALRALLRTHGIESLQGQRLWSKKGLAWLEALAMPTNAAAFERDEAIDDVAYFNRKIERTDRKLAAISHQHPGIALLRTIPGVGIRTAEAFLAYVDDPSRFGANSIGPYLGLVPSQDASAGMNRLGRITKDGPGTVRGLLAEAAWQAIRRSPTVRAFFERIKRDDPGRRKKALVATAHYLARIMLAMLTSGEAWREEESRAAAA